MSKFSLGIFDKEREYAERLGAYIMMKEGASFDPHVYTEEKMLLSSLDRLDFALVPEDFEAAYDDGRLIRLVEKLDSNPGKQIEKYRRAPDIIVQLRDLFEIKDSVRESLAGRIICVASPARHELQMLFSLCLCKERSINRRVLYVNLLDTSGFENIFNCMKDRTLEDILAVIHDDKVSLETYTQDVEGVSVILPCGRPEALWETDEGQMQRLIELFESSSYELVIMDMGSSFPGCYDIYDAADSIIALGRDGFLSEEAHRQWMSNLIRHLGDDAEEKTERMILPLTSAGIRPSEFLLNELHRGNLGDFIRENVSAGK